MIMNKEELRKNLYDLFTLKINHYSGEINNKKLYFVNMNQETSENKIRMMYGDLCKEYETKESGFDYLWNINLNFNFLNLWKYF
jgi:hypothetical protein